MRFEGVRHLALWKEPHLTFLLEHLKPDDLEPAAFCELLGQVGQHGTRETLAALHPYVDSGSVWSRMTGMGDESRIRGAAVAARDQIRVRLGIEGSGGQLSLAEAVGGEVSLAAATEGAVSLSGAAEGLLDPERLVVAAPEEASALPEEFETSS
jgi:hypothetical protein